mgnify:CR=1 FL=1
MNKGANAIRIYVLIRSEALFLEVPFMLHLIWLQLLNYRPDHKGFVTLIMNGKCRVKLDTIY